MKIWCCTHTRAYAHTHTCVLLPSRGWDVACWPLQNKISISSERQIEKCHIAVAQWLEDSKFNRGVVGSSPTREGPISTSWKFRLFQEHLFIVEIEAVVRAWLSYHVLTFTKQYESHMWRVLGINHLPFLFVQIYLFIPSCAVGQ